MGVISAHSFLRKKSFNPASVSQSALEQYTKFHVDVLGSYYPVLIDNFYKHPPSQAATLVIEKLKSMLPMEKTILYLDGNKSAEKQATTERRSQVKEKDMRRLQAQLRIAESKAAQGHRISASQIKEITRLSRRAFHLTSEMKRIFLETASKLGCNVKSCRGEADVHIGSLSLKENEVVVSGDSDLLFYTNVHDILRPLGNGNFLPYNKSDLLRLLQVTAVQWASIGIVSGNDYDKNIKGFGISTNHKLISEISGKDITTIIVQYLKLDNVKKANVSSTAFKAAVKIFDKQIEDIQDNRNDNVEDTQQAPQDHGFLKKRLKEISAKAKQIRIAERRAKR
jgi:hypothetical protein